MLLGWMRSPVWVANHTLKLANPLSFPVQSYSASRSRFGLWIGLGDGDGLGRWAEVQESVVTLLTEIVADDLAQFDGHSGFIATVLLRRDRFNGRRKPGCVERATLILGVKPAVCEFNDNRFWIAWYHIVSWGLGALYKYPPTDTGRLV